MEKKEEQAKKAQQEKPVIVNITNNNEFHKGVGAFITNLNHLTIVMDSEGNMKLDANQVPAPVMPHTEVEVDKPQKEKTQEACPPMNPVVSKCFKFVNAFIKEKVETLFSKYYQTSHADLALIEIALYDHEAVKKRNSHKAFLDALIAWGILKVKDDEEYKLILFGIKDKHKRLPKAGGYMDWSDDDLQYEKNICENIGRELGDTMPYRYKKHD
jgi:hypothetical protein